MVREVVSPIPKVRAPVYVFPRKRHASVPRDDFQGCLSAKNHLFTPDKFTMGGAVLTISRDTHAHYTLEDMEFRGFSPRARREDESAGE